MELFYTETSKEHEGVTFLLYAQVDDLPVRGNALASGNDAEDKKAEDSILRKLRNGSIWAWASVKVVASRKEFSGVDYLGACSYKDFRDFIQPGGYYDDMKQVALDNLLAAENEGNKDAA